MGKVGLALRDEPTPPIVPFPDEFGVASEGARRGQFLGAVLAP